jgi:hypothetical protein
MNIEAQLVESISHTVQEIVRATLNLPAAGIFGIVCIPLCLAAFSRNILSVTVAAAMSILSYIALMQGNHSGSDAVFTLAIYMTALFAGFLGHGEARQAQRIASASQEIDRLRLEMQSFLEAVDRRTLAMDQFARREDLFSRSEPSDRARAPEEA